MTARTEKSKLSVTTRHDRYPVKKNKVAHPSKMKVADLLATCRLEYPCKTTNAKKLADEESQTPSKLRIIFSKEFMETKPRKSQSLICLSVITGLLCQPQFAVRAFCFGLLLPSSGQMQLQILVCCILKPRLEVSLFA